MAVALLALFFALGGSSLAAKHYLLSSSDQISPRLLKSLKGDTGRRGPRGAEGPQGVQGTQGAQGVQGAAGTFNGTLPSGTTLRGTFGVSSNAGGLGYDGLTVRWVHAAGGHRDQRRRSRTHSATPLWRDCRRP